MSCLSPTVDFDSVSFVWPLVSTLGVVCPLKSRSLSFEWQLRRRGARRACEQKGDEKKGRRRPRGRLVGVNVGPPLAFAFASEHCPNNSTL